MRQHLRLASLVLLFAAFAPLHAQQAAWTATFYVIKGGKDTVAVEHFTRDPATLTGELLQSNGVRAEYVANLRADQSVEHLEMQRAGQTGPSALLSVDFGDTLVTATMTAGDKTQKINLPTLLKPHPFLINSFALMEQIVRANHLAVGKSVRVIAARLGAGDTATVTVSRPHADSVVVDAPQGAIRMAVSSDGDVLGAIFPAGQWVIERRKGTGKP